ncbi:TetR family transcriptional regulator [Alphaproteobacteria bacterium GH1-50]|uniref:TetR family transcriptional regulator n=1 Tax=Kangsaoukella pontilimi TaxID=2691042 RepID=A0A7C9MVY3_9RHOB|nr:TetR/AcrR family transcriptional regulator [Kangsaoukella pontilimi]MXQ08000.1 TetR family transcriptional regulator [Kangsaoukella pontilimi]
MARKAGSHAEITGPAIREAALKLFARSGYAAVSMREIAAEVGVQAGALYLYTPDKQTLLFELMRGHLEDLLAAWADIPEAGAPADRLEAFVRFHLGYHLNRPDAVFLAYMELRNLTPENFAVIEGLRRRYEAELEQILIAGHEDGSFRMPDARVTAMAMIAMLAGVHVWYRPDGRLTPDRIERIYVRLARRMVKA